MTADLPLLQRGTAQPPAEQIAAHFAAAIQAGRLRVGERLPPIRTVAEATGVTRATAHAAYQRLRRQGLIEATVGRGTIVRASTERADRASPLSGPAAAALRRVQAPMPALPEGSRCVANFAPLAPDHALFPVAEFQSSLERVLREHGAELLAYGPAEGLPRLRELLCARSDPGTEVSEILVTSGAQQGLDLVLRAVASPGDAVAVPVPTYHHLISLLRAQSLQLLPVNQDERGLDLQELQRVLPRARLLYVMPTLHNPTGRTLDLAQREALMQIVARTRVPVLEDEFQRDLRPGKPLPSLRSLDPRRLTITARSFSKGLFPGVRIGWLCGSHELLAGVATLKRLCDLETSSLLQAALADFVATGAVERYLVELRQELGRRHAAAQKALSAHMPPGAHWTQPEGGFVFWLELPARLDAQRFAELAASRGVLVTPGRLFDPLDRPQSAFRLSLARTDCAATEAGIRVLAACARECLSGISPSPSPLFL